MLHGRVMVLRKKKTQSNRFNRIPHRIRVKVQSNPRSLQKIRASRTAGNGSAAMLGNTDACTGRNKGSGCADVKGMRAIPTGATGIDQAVNRNFDAIRYRADDFCRRDDFIDRLPLDPKGHQETSDLGWCGLSLHDAAHHRMHFGMAEVRPFNKKTNGVTDIHKGICWGSAGAEFGPTA